MVKEGRYDIVDVGMYEELVGSGDVPNQIHVIESDENAVMYQEIWSRDEGRIKTVGIHVGKQIVNNAAQPAQ